MDMGIFGVDIHSPHDFSWQTEKPRWQRRPTLSAPFHKASFGLSAQVPGFLPQITVSSFPFHNQNLQLSHFTLQGLFSSNLPKAKL